MPSFAVGETDFLLDAAPFRVLSGALHYFRVHQDQWSDRIRKARLMGLNTIETYVPWNEHAPVRGEFRTDGLLDLGRFLDLVHAEGMRAIVRPGPYICAEWHDGGLPGWLVADPSIKLRSSDPAYLEAIAEYLEDVYAIVRPRQIQHGGPVVLVQIENEYGAYGADREYLRRLTEMTRDLGIDVPLTTVDQPNDEMLANGSLDELHRTASFGSRATERLAALRRHQPTGPLMCSEFWCGWFDSWGEIHHTASAEESARELDEMLAAGASVNIYMFHGGTNFGFTNGANDKGTYRPIVTSYDYDAPLAEDGTPTEKYWRFREVIAKYAPVPEELAEDRRDAPVLGVRFGQSVPLRSVPVIDAQPFDHLPDATELGSARGFTCYSTMVEHGGLLTFAEVRDRAQVFLDGALVGTLDRELHERMLPLPSRARGELTVLVENLGGVNYGPRLGEAKGLIGPVTLDGVEITTWVAGGVRLDDLGPIRDALSTADDGAGSAVVEARRRAVCGPAFARGSFVLDEAADLHLDLRGWGKGVLWVNGVNLGRYWSRGPQRTSYVPAPVTRAGENEVLVFETIGAASATAQFVARPELGPTEA
ncbi:beta-galactosidase family protein [Oerskovia sp. KBS0722]|uniref:glycoside hydrolase family 35 protein n=1 Tax=Oerskovia sp. KBS0722 TaxID=1179673 RepID=UPI00110E3E52|nr:beta-galactosidase family protein [Oerskovia sp. KBS0722]QDW61330.1 beta-galactosidase [Oerskovia sp. KBS0722]